MSHQSCIIAAEVNARELEQRGGMQGCCGLSEPLRLGPEDKRELFERYNEILRQAFAAYFEAA